jgi:peptide/nickel transport system substrate-binding protein
MPLIAALLTLAAPALAGKADDTLVWATGQAVPTADPYYNQIRETIIITHNVCDGLVYDNPDNHNFEPLLATSWQQVDPTTIDFTLRHGVTFHDGRPFSADDVVYTYNWVANPAHGVMSQSSVNWIASAEKLADDKVRIHLKTTLPTALDDIADNVPIVPAGHYDAAPDIGGGRKGYGQVPVVCTGPWKVVRVVPGQGIDFAANAAYFGGAKARPSIGHMKFRTIPDPETQISELMTGGVDWIWIASKDRADLVQQMGRAQVVALPILRMDFIQFDSAGRGGKNPFQDVRVRRAVAHAINRRAIADSFVGKAASVMHAACQPIQFGCTEDVQHYDYDPARARALLAEAGYPNGLDVDFYAYLNREWTEAVMGDLRAVGIRARLKFLQFQALLPMTRNAQAQFSHLSWASLGIRDVSAITGWFFTGSPDDQARDPQVIAWVKAGDAALDPEQRKENYKRALQRIAEQAYWVPLWNYVRYYGLSADLTWPASADDIPRFWLAKWK